MLTDADPRTLLSFCVYLAVVGAGVVALAISGQGDFVDSWLAFAGLGGLSTIQHARSAGKVDAVKRSVGETNGEDLAQMMKRLTELDQYSHTRNHDILNSLARIEAAMQLEAIEAQADAKTRRRPR